jgi:hypothetical protein
VSHVEPDQLALLALGEPVTTDEDERHLASCERCRAELAEMRRTVRIARSTIGEDSLEVPSEAVWGRIQDELGMSPSSVEHGADLETVGDELPPAGTDAHEAVGRTPPRRAGRGIRRLWTPAAAIAIVAAVGLGGWGLAQRLAPVSIAQASLSAFPDHPDATGTADVEEARDGSRTLVLTLEAGAPPDTYREVWLIRNDAAALISLGVLTGDSGSFPIPAGVDLAEYSLVDVSVEPIDGDPQHSGDSIVRGELAFA